MASGHDLQRVLFGQALGRKSKTVPRSTGPRIGAVPSVVQKEDEVCLHTLIYRTYRIDYDAYVGLVGIALFSARLELSPPPPG